MPDILTCCPRLSLPGYQVLEECEAFATWKLQKVEFFLPQAVKIPQSRIEKSGLRHRDSKVHKAHVLVKSFCK